jgi:hypothetical protein
MSSGLHKCADNSCHTRVDSPPPLGRLRFIIYVRPAATRFSTMSRSLRAPWRAILKRATQSQN